jgi:hypothetical protein
MQTYSSTGVLIPMQPAQCGPANGLSTWPAAIALLILVPNLYGLLLLHGQEIIGSTGSPAELVNRLCVAQDKREAAVGPQADAIREMRRWNTVKELVGLGTNAWPAVPALVATMSYPDLAVVAAAAEVLAGVQADRYPGWGSIENAFRGQTNAFYAFRWLVLGKDRFSVRMDRAHRKFGLIGLAAVGPIANPVVPDLKAMIGSKEDHELWSAAVASLRAIGSDAKELGPDLKRTLTSPDEHPEVRVSAAGALTTLLPEDPETRALLQEMLRDGSSHVRIAAGRGLWALKEPADEVLPTLISLLHHKLASVRLAALNGLLEMGPAAAPSSPSLLELAEDGNTGVRQAAEEVIRRIHARAESQP